MTTIPSQLDETVLDELRAAMSESAFTELAGTFLEQLRAVGSRFRIAAEANDRLRAEHAAHELAGIAGTMGAMRLAESARTAMACCRRPHFDVRTVAETVSHDVDSALAAFHSYVRRCGG